jgi:protein-tyrosine phosphatase
MAIQSILLVCTGNICRSPLAEGLLRQHLPQLRIYSAGLAAVLGQPATAETQALALAAGADIAAHRAQQINAFLVQSAQLILVAEQRQRQDIEKQYPTSRGRVFRICEASQQDIPDPYLGDAARYQSSAALTALGIADWAQKITTLNRT